MGEVSGEAGQEEGEPKKEKEESERSSGIGDSASLSDVSFCLSLEEDATTSSGVSLSPEPIGGLPEDDTASHLMESLKRLTEVNTAQPDTAQTLPTLEVSRPHAKDLESPKVSLVAQVKTVEDSIDPSSNFYHVTEDEEDSDFSYKSEDNEEVLERLHCSASLDCLLSLLKTEEPPPERSLSVTNLQLPDNKSANRSPRGSLSARPPVKADPDKKPPSGRRSELRLSPTRYTVRPVVKAHVCSASGPSKVARYKPPSSLASKTAKPLENKYRSPSPKPRRVSAQTRGRPSAVGPRATSLSPCKPSTEFPSPGHAVTTSYLARPSRSPSPSLADRMKDFDDNTSFILLHDDDDLTECLDRPPSSRSLQPPSPSSPSLRSKSSISRYTPQVSTDRLKELRAMVDKAAQGQKTFTIFGKFPSIRDALKSRGWVQNFDVRKLSHPRIRHWDPEYRYGTPSNIQSGEDSQMITRMLRDTPVSFVWVMGDSIDWKSLSKSTLVSRFPRVYFTTKVGLCSYLQQSHWFCEDGVSNPRFPRCYNLSTPDDFNTFVKDFRMTACLSILQCLVAAINMGRVDYFNENGKVPLSAVEFALKRCTEFVASQEHEDIDKETHQKIWDHQWDQFLTHYYQLVQERASFLPATEVQIKMMYSCSKLAVESVKPYWPHLEMDGVSNLWIVKPAAKSRGRGIKVMKNLEEIAAKIGALHPNDARFVIQKYIERPLLIHDTKFDIRQWFLVTCAYPLTIWMYKESYLRFCSQLYSLTDMHESVHLSNNAVQCKYKNAKRNPALPDENMWDCYTFKTYLRTLGQAEKWESVIYPGMRECIIGTLLAAQEHMDHRRNCFELYGADFILTEDLVPWLIEINSSPCMSPTTSVTASMCSQCLEDVIKVVIDRRMNRDAETGMFELIYRQQVSHPQPYMGMNLTVRGKRINRNPRCRNSLPSYEDYKETEYASVAVQEAIDELSLELMKTGDEEDKVDLDLEPDNAQPVKSVKKAKMNDNGSSGQNEAKPEKTPEPKPKVKKKTYKKHSCVNQANSFQGRRHPAGMPRRTRVHSNSLNFLESLDSGQIQANDIVDWKQRVEETRATCEQMLSKLKDPTLDKNSALRNEIIQMNRRIVHYKLPKVRSMDTIFSSSSMLRREPSFFNLPDIKMNIWRDINNNLHNNDLKKNGFKFHDSQLLYAILDKYNLDKHSSIKAHKLLK